MAREVTVRLSADIAGYIQAMDQAAQATDRAATSADNLEQAASRASQSTQQSSQGIQQAGSAASDASGSLEGLSGGMESAGSSAEVLSSNLDRSGTASQSFSDSLSTVGAQSQDAAGAMLSVGESATTVSSNLDGSGSQLNSFEGALSSVGAQSQSAATDMLSVSAGAEGASQSAGSARDAFSEFGSEMSRINSESRAFAGGLALVGGGITALMASVISTGIEYNTLQQVAGRAMETMTGSAEAAADQMDRLHEFADTSPFARDVWITAQQQLMAFGMEAENVVPTMEGIQNAVAAIGGGDQEIMQLVDILGQVQGQGRITGRELQRMGQMGINAADIIGEAMGVSGNEIRAQITAGALDAETAISALTDGMNTRFEGAAEGLRDTMTGAIDRIQARVRDLGGIIATPLVDPSGGGFLVGAINQAADFGAALLELPDLLLQIGGLGLTAVGGILALGGAWGLASTQIAAFATGVRGALPAIANLTTSLVGAVGGWGRFAAGAGIAVAALAGLAIIRHVRDDSEEFAASVGRMSYELQRAAEGGQAFNDIDWSRGGIAINDLSEAVDYLGSNDGMIRFERGADRVVTSVLGIGTHTKDLEENIESVDEALSGALQTHNFDWVAASIEQMGLSAAEIVEFFPEFTEQIDQAALSAGQALTNQERLALFTNAAAMEALFAGESWEFVSGLLDEGADATYNAASAFEEAAGSARVLGDAYGEVAGAVDEATGSLGDLIDNLMSVGEMNMDAEAKVHSHADSVRNINELFEEEESRLSDLNTALNEGTISQAEYDDQLGDTLITLDETTQAGSDYNGMMRDMVTDVHSAAEGMAILGASEETLAEHLNSGIEDIISWRMAAGESREEAEEWARTMLGIPDDISIETDMDRRAQLIAEETARTINEIPTWIEILVGADDEEAQAALTALETGDYETLVDILGNDEQARELVMAFMADDWETVVEILGEDGPAQDRMRDFVDRPWNTDIEFGGVDTPARGDMSRFTGTPWATDVRFDGNNRPARADMGLFINTPWNTTITANANTWAAEGALTRLARTRTMTIVANVSGGGAGRAIGSMLGRAEGGIAGMRGYSSGGHLPYTGLGRDQIIGVDRHLNPFVRVDDGEFITRESSTRKYLPALWALNRDDPKAAVASLQGFASGGVPGGTMRPREFRAAPQVSSSSVQVIQQTPATEMTGTLYMENGALLGQVRMALQDPGVVQAASRGLAEKAQRDSRGPRGKRT